MFMYVHTYVSEICLCLMCLIFMTRYWYKCQACWTLACMSLKYLLQMGVSVGVPWLLATKYMRV